MAKKSSSKRHKITVTSEARGILKVRQTADYLFGIGRDAVSKAKGSAIAWIMSKRPRTLTSSPLSSVRHKTRKPRMAQKIARKSPSKR